MLNTLFFKLNIGTLLLILSINCSAQQNLISVEKNYNNWNWESVYVAKNKYISLAVVPEAAGRILEYNLGDTPSLWVNPKLFGKSFPATDLVKKNEWRNFGGYRLVPLPIEESSIDLNGNKKDRWPPPAIIGDAAYNVSIDKNKDGKQTINVISGVQELPVPFYYEKEKRFVYPDKIEEKIQYSRSLYIEPNSSLVYITHTLKNVGNSPIKKGIMVSSQHVSWTDPKLQDGYNYVAYVPFSKDLKLPSGQQFEITTNANQRWNYINKNRFKLDKNNPEHIKKYYNNGTNWKGEVAPGIYEIEYDYNQMAGFHMISSESWLCYVNKTNNTAFVKIMEPYNPKLEYDHGLNMAVFCSGLETGYIETEVKTPLYKLKPNHSFDYQEIHGAAKIETTPVLGVNLAGVVTQKLNFNKELKNITGSYGVFTEGDALIKLLDKDKKIIKEIKIQNVNPLKVFKLQVKVDLPKNTSKIELMVIDSHQKETLLDKMDFN
ncbi:hypothetical protein AXE80_10220 [Wenyingzhuangia fucanilytica]|uniref:Uncharacterized protein n=1 Tax=Wenyingzhuangia fucanilytica TaxID=1790137 RepID=A0A1B1Y7B1_9FLAO|nr:hypothetical protein [Wenyingzhuangia fucanilytica]ANW96628.1 hypothetical protein AXE80_10220 [Wenyingzhuangia fucanilytica]